MTFQPDLELREKVFIKMEWEQLDAGRDTDDLWWWKKDKSDGGYFQELPPIETSWEVCVEYLVPFMRERGIKWDIVNSRRPNTGRLFCWREKSTAEFLDKGLEIHNDNIALAACEAFMEVEM